MIYDKKLLTVIASVVYLILYVKKGDVKKGDGRYFAYWGCILQFCGCESPFSCTAPIISLHFP